MREILFRGKETFTNKWVYGSLINASDYCCILQNEEDLHPADLPYLSGETGVFDGSATPIDKTTIGQYTGCKDKNGKKIFEGDIVKTSIFYDIGCYPHSEEKIVEVEYIDGCFYPLYDYERGKIEVIGNIYDNPELLEGDDE